ncbi:MAG: aminoacyl-tRNA hydrolase [Patescibacteria group bacterium]
MIKLVIGLGNPETKYFKNRHNTGYIFIEELLKRGISKSIIAKKTNIFMNDSGSIVKNLHDKYKISLDDLYIVHDDLDIPLGEFKIQKAVGPKLHNGISSIDEKLKNSEYWRVRIGVDARAKSDREPGEKYVLEDFEPEEEKILIEVIDKAINKLLFLVKNGQ